MLVDDLRAGSQGWSGVRVREAICGDGYARHRSCCERPARGCGVELRCGPSLVGSRAERGLARSTRRGELQCATIQSRRPSFFSLRGQGREWAALKSKVANERIVNLVCHRVPVHESSDALEGCDPFQSYIPPRPASPSHRTSLFIVAARIRCSCSGSSRSRSLPCVTCLCSSPFFQATLADTHS